MSFRLFIVLILNAFLFGCGGQGSGYAPSAAPPSVPASSSYDMNFKYGESVTASNGWNVSLDTTDPIEDTALGNGWTVEVKYE